MTLPLTGEAEQPTQIEILGGNDITVEKDYWRAPEVVKLGSVDGNKPPARWMFSPYFSGSIGVPQSNASHRSGRRPRQDRAVSRPLCHSRVVAFEELESLATEDEIAAEWAVARTTNVPVFARKRPARQPFP